MMNKGTRSMYGILLATGLLITSCHSNKTEVRQDPNLNGSADSGLLFLTARQHRKLSVVTGKMELHRMDSVLECRGVVQSPPENTAEVTVPVGGLLRSFPWHPGDYVNAGQVIAVLEHPDYITLQQDFLEAKSRWEYYKEEFKRQGELTVENAASVKSMQQAQADFRTIEVRMAALKQRLGLLGIHADSLHIDKLSATITLRAPISGYIASSDIALGKFIDPQHKVCTMVNANNLYLDLFPEEQDVHRIRAGQPLEFCLPGEPGKKYNALIKGIAPSQDKSLGRFLVRARMQTTVPGCTPGMSVKAFISIPSRLCPAIPCSALVNESLTPAIFIKTEDAYRRVLVQTGRIETGWVELTGFPEHLKEAEIVFQGAQSLEMAWKQHE